jgi:sugar lactone lactonase YvrE
MKNRNCTVWALALLALAVTATHTRAQSTYTPYAFTNFAGLPGASGTNDGTGGAARFIGPRGVAVDGAGNVYVADTYNYTIRKITPAGAVTTLAGSAGLSGSANGINSVARFNQPSGVAVDGGGNLYVADYENSTIRKITPVGTNWVVTTLAGSAGQTGGADGTNSVARFNQPNSVAVDSAGNIYVADKGNSTIRKITPGGVVTTLAGIVTHTGSADGIGTNALFYLPFGVAADGAGNLYVADTFNNRITKGTPDASSVSLTIRYNGTSVVLDWPGSHTLQSTPSLNVSFTNVPGPVLTGPYTNTPLGPAQFFRLRD